MKALPFLLSALGGVLLSLAHAKDPLDPGKFAHASADSMTREELRRYVIERDNLQPKRGDLMANDGLYTGDPDKEALLKLSKEDLIGRLSYFESKLKAIRRSMNEEADLKIGAIKFKAGLKAEDQPPYPVALVRQAEHLIVKADGKVVSEKPKDEPWKKPGLFGEAKELEKHDGKRGPFLLRKTADDWSGDLTDAAGAKVTYADDRLSKKSKWSSEGAVIYPIALGGKEDGNPGRPKSGNATLQVLPALGWKIADVQETATGDVEELQLQAPLVWSTPQFNVGWLSNSVFSFSPYTLTDFHFKGAVLGATASFAPFIFDRKSGFAINKGYTGLCYGPVLYRIGFEPGLDYNHLSSTSRFITRDDHKDHFRIGGKTELALRWQDFPSLEFVISYQGFASISGGPSHSDLFSYSAKIWLNEYAGLSLEHQKGSTPVADKDVNLTTFGFEFRF